MAVRPDVGAQAFVLLVQCFLLRRRASQVTHVDSFFRDEDVGGDGP